MTTEVKASTRKTSITKVEDGGSRSGSHHVVLLGDSIFDNALAIHRHLSHRLLSRNPVTLLARGGSVAAEVHAQLRHTPSDVTQFVLSVGGNDAFRMVFPQYYRMYRDSSRSGMGLYWSILKSLPAQLSEFEGQYDAALEAVCRWKKPVLVLLPYGPQVSGSMGKALVSAGLCLLHRSMRRVAEKHNCNVLDLRGVITKAQDYSDPIHPSHQGMEKIAAAIANELGFSEAK